MATEKSTMAIIRAARPSFRNRYDKAAFAVHAAFLSAGYIMKSTDASVFDDALSSATDDAGMDNWNEIEDNYAFVYSNLEKRSKKVLMKCFVMNDKLLIDALKEGDSNSLHLEVDVGEYVEDNGETDYGLQFKNLGKLVAAVSEQVLGKLDGPFPSATSSSSQCSSSQKYTRDDRDRAVMEVADPEEPYISHPPSGYVVPPIPAFGGSDLFPGPGAGMYPTRADLGGGSMLIGPQDPRFFGGRTVPRLPGGLPGVPPGARFDPYGPPDVPGFEQGRFVRNPRRPGGGTHPDLPHFPDGSDFI